MQLRIWHLYPQDMNIYGDRGNVIALVQRARWRGIEVELHACDVGDRLDGERCDLLFAGGGDELPGIGLLDLHTVAGRRRLIGDALVEAEVELPDGSPGTLVGFENHSGQTFLGPGCRRLGRVVVGGGNNGQDGGEGAVHRWVHGTYLHGPVLPKNPWLTDRLIEQALRRRGWRGELPRLDDREEVAAHRTVAERTRRGGRRDSGVV